MMKLIIAGVWACIVTLGAVYGTMAMQKAKNEPKSEAVAIELRKTRPLSVPMIAEGRVTGYVLAQFAYTIDAEGAKHMAVPPDIFLLDEAFKMLYGDPNLDFRHLEKYDVTSLTRTLLTRVNTRLNGKVLVDVMLQEFAYISKGDIQKDG